jgi:hypothetical protein
MTRESAPRGGKKPIRRLSVAPLPSQAELTEIVDEAVGVFPAAAYGAQDVVRGLSAPAITEIRIQFSQCSREFLPNPPDSAMAG